ncbi:hypothetical protein F511_33094 [Dorcoceras hygrometricum]|uniref:Uncharacterized protein n=1 Tax=Dorcoceras hygrometricum TaxID=472368 RepID=A0A2Z7CJP5_9LAMI|nr:hypothetical protein F511_33094 [Dorcoceras hygrometricum]
MKSDPPSRHLRRLDGAAAGRRRHHHEKSRRQRATPRALAPSGEPAPHFMRNRLRAPAERHGANVRTAARPGVDQRSINEAAAAGHHAQRRTTTHGAALQRAAVSRVQRATSRSVSAAVLSSRNKCAWRRRCATIHARLRPTIGDHVRSLAPARAPSCASVAPPHAAVAWPLAWTGPTGPGPTGENSVHPHHCDFIVTPIADQIGPIDSVSKTEYYDMKNHFSEPQCKMTVLPLNVGKSRFDPRIQLAVGPQPLRFRNHNSGLAHRIMVKRLATSPHDPLGITDSACKKHLVVVSVQYGPFNPYITIRSTTIGKSRVAKDPIAMHTSWRSNSDIASVTSIGYPRMSSSGESSTTMHRLLHASGSHPIPTPYDPKGVGKRVKVRRLSCRVSMMFRVVRTNQYNQDLGLIHSTNGNHLESPKEGSSIDHQVTIYLHAQNITMFPTNETWYFASQILVSNSGGLILILTAQSTRNSSEYTVTIRCVS